MSRAMPPFTFETALQPRYRDLDPNGHVNNAVYVSYLEQTRTEYWRAVMDEPLSVAGVAIVSLSIDFEAEIDLEDDVEVVMRHDPPGRSSLPQVYQIHTGRGIAARAEAVMVAFDRDARESTRLPEEWRERIGAYEAANGNDWSDS